MRTFSAIANQLYDAALAVLFPQSCHICGAAVESRVQGIACERCWERTRLFSSSENLCWKCGVLAPTEIEIANPEDLHCHRCDDAVFKAARACGLYEGALRATVLALKSKPYISDQIVRLMFEKSQTAPLTGISCIMPVPLHPEREKQRGFNQAGVLAAALAEKAQVPLLDRVLARTDYTERHRAGMDARLRRESVANAFVVLNRKLVEGESVLIIDDVFTTGATVSACAQALSTSGAAEVFVLTLARSAY